LNIHESPSLSPLGKQKIKKGMVMTIEPGIYLPGKFGIRLENTVLLTEKGAENISTLPS
jgi:Xaa-Pro aminopeptidase